MKAFRKALAWVMVVLVSLLVPVTIITAWALNTVINTDQYVATLSPLAHDKVVTDAIAVRGSDLLFKKVDVHDRIEKALPKKASPLATPLTDQIRTFTQDQLKKVLHSEWFGHLWDTANRRTHDAAIGVLTGHPPPGVKNAKKVVVNVTPLLIMGIDKLRDQGITYFDGLKKPLEKTQELTVNVSSSEQIGKAQNLFYAASKLKWFVPLITGLVLVIGVAVAVERRRTFLRMAVGAAIGTVVVLGALSLFRSFFVQRATKKGGQGEVPGTVFDTVVRFLRDGLYLVVLIAVVAALISYLAGPGRFPVWLRAKVVVGAKRAASFVTRLISQGFTVLSPRAKQAAGYTVSHESAVRLAGLILAGIFVLAGAIGSTGAVWTLLIAVAAYLVVAQGLFALAKRVAAPTAPTDGAATTDVKPSEPKRSETGSRT